MKSRNLTNCRSFPTTTNSAKHFGITFGSHFHFDLDFPKLHCSRTLFVQIRWPKGRKQSVVLRNAEDRFRIPKLSPFSSSPEVRIAKENASTYTEMTQRKNFLRFELHWDESGCGGDEEGIPNWKSCPHNPPSQWKLLEDQGGLKLIVYVPTTVLVGFPFRTATMSCELNL